MQITKIKKKINKKHNLTYFLNFFFRMYIKYSIQILFLSTILLTCFADVPRKPPISLSEKKDQKSAKLPACKACTILVDSFKKVKIINSSIYLNIIIILIKILGN